MPRNNFTITLVRWRRSAWLGVYERGQRELLLLLLEFINKKMFDATGALECWPSIERTLAPLLGRHRNIVNTDMTRLAERGVIVIEKRGRSNRYIFQQSWLEATEQSQDARWNHWPDKSLDGPKENQPKDKAAPRKAAPSNGSMEKAERELRHLDTDGVTRTCEEEFVKIDLNLVNFGPKVRSPGAVLRAQFRKLIAMGFSGETIVKSQKKFISTSQRAGERAFWDVEILAQDCRDDAMENADAVDDDGEELRYADEM